MRGKQPRLRNEASQQASKQGKAGQTPSTGLLGIRTGRGNPFGRYQRSPVRAMKEIARGMPFPDLQLARVVRLLLCRIVVGDPPTR